MREDDYQRLEDWTQGRKPPRNQEARAGGTPASRQPGITSGPSNRSGCQPTGPNAYRVEQSRTGKRPNNTTRRSQSRRDTYRTYDKQHFSDLDAERLAEFSRNSSAKPTTRATAPSRKARQDKAKHAAGKSKRGGKQRSRQRLPDVVHGITCQPAERRLGFPDLINRPPGDLFELCVGIDAGTSGIRVALHDVYSNDTHLFDFGPNLSAGTRFSWPSVIAVENGCLLFGNDAAKAPGTNRFVSFKAALLHDKIEKELRTRWFGIGASRSSGLKDGFPSPADFLLAISVGRALELAVPSLMRHHQPGAAGFQLSIGAPLTGSRFVADRFHRALGCAALLVGAIGERPRVDALLRHYADVWQSATKVCRRPIASQPLYVRSEALSALRSQKDGLQLGETFLIADIGATTTDISVVRVGDEILSCFAADSLAIGVDQIDRALLERQPGFAKDLLEMRMKRHELGSSFAERAPAFRTVVADVANSLKQAIREAFRKAVHRNDDPSSWGRCYVVVAGGGSNIPELRQAITGTPPHNYVRQWTEAGAHVQSAAVHGNSRNRPSSHEAFELLSVMGSTMPAWEEMEYRTPDQLETRVQVILESPIRELDRVRYLRWV